LRKIKKKVVKKLNTRKEAFEQANLQKVKMKVLDEELELQMNMVQNELTRTIILLVTYMVKHGHDANTKEVFKWVKEQASQDLLCTLEKGLGIESV
ncbi:MAG: hypothetical protein JWQ14_1008, partial [Adhaeribacter sp.]|nr:hypothetical protein [Adhaeribacter sp.]